MRLWPFRRQVSARSRSVALPPLAEAAPADMSRLLRIESDETKALEAARSRLRIMGMSLGVGFLLLAGRAVDIAVMGPADAAPIARQAVHAETRGDLFDRTGQVLATTLQTHSLYADPSLVWDARETAEALATVLPDIDVDALTEELGGRGRFVWVQRNLTPRQRRAPAMRDGRQARQGAPEVRK